MRRGLGVTSILAAGRGSTVMRAKPMVGRICRPGIRPTAETLSAPVAPALTRPVESTLPSKNPPLVNQANTTPSSGLPAES